MTETMTKYGVDTTPVAATPTTRCPSCNASLDGSAPPHCPHCGTKPFEHPGAAPPASKGAV